ncbi:hypothetical protein [Microbacterium sp. SA39]|uniref:hypothetical protein n=1 Tax=Microbacterium sp. SA39 TaxID=1263625 RepID=UPI0005FA2B79|nr:hypothetical protein [Microbacterium sp. SA39]KJQ55071.1 hypothetical protein RS85_01130 [Microbacterium sp. SA39]
MTEEINTSKGFSRRTVVKGAAWSVPVIAAAVATPLAAASLAGDLTAAFSGPLALNLSLGPITLATVNAVNTLTITNAGPAASPVGATANVQYLPSLLTLNIAAVGGVTVAGSDGNFTLTLPSIAAGDSLVINLGTTLDTLLDLGLLTSLAGGPAQTISATLGGDGVPGNNTAVAPIGITLL